MNGRLAGIIALSFFLTLPALGQTWVEYNGDTLPDAASPAWIHEDAGGVSTASGGTLVITGTGSRERWTQTGINFNVQTGWTVQFRMRVLPNNADWDRETEILSIRDGSNRLRLFLGETLIGPDGLQTKDQGVNGNTFVPTTTLYDMQGWHTYRITGKNSTLATGGVFNIYRDGNAVPIMTGTLGSPIAENLIKIGALNSNEDISFELDYFWWANDGAFPPTVPEPGDPEPSPLNPDFDNIDDPDGSTGPTPGVPLHWTTWQTPGSGTATLTEEKGIWRHTAFAKALRIYEPNFDYNGGVRQTVSTTPGFDYTFSTWLNFYAADATTHSGRVGIDPTGGTNLANVVWGIPVALGAGPYQNVTISTTAQGSSITLYVNGIWTTSGASERSLFVDDTSLTVSPTPPVSGVMDLFKMFR